MQLAEFDYHLPEELIAQEALADRAASRMLVVHRESGSWEDRAFRDLPEFLRTGDCLVLNDSRVFPARLFGRRAGVHSLPVGRNNPKRRENLSGTVEVFLLRSISADGRDWQALVRPGRKMRTGERIAFDEGLEGEIIARGEFGERHIRFAPVDDFFARVEKIGHIPLPPYIARADSPVDRDRYQTVYARERGSVAAPTAGLHFTPEILSRLHDRGIETTQVTLHVGLGTFQPVRVEKVEEHQLHSESYSISEEAAAKIRQARRESRRVVAVGTTTVRTLEYAARQGGGEVRAGAGEANLFIYPGYKFQAVKALLTNFHLPQSTLLMLVCALGGKEFVLKAYRHAVAERYRFYSYGDCMFVE